jgi:hypothetical protein
MLEEGLTWKDDRPATQELDESTGQTLPWWMRHWQQLGWALFVGFCAVAYLAVRLL